MKNTNKDQKSQRENQLEPLIDLKPSGKKRNWDKSKRMSLAVAHAYSQNPDLERYEEKIKHCGSDLGMKACPTDILHGKKLFRANFCKCRLCTTCQGRKSNVIRKQVIDLVHEHLARYSTDVPLLFTTTVLNEPGENMIRTIDKMTAAWNRLMPIKPLRGVVRSWFRSLEVTYNPDRDDFHPHFHSILMMPKAYFCRKNGLYITHDEFLKLWQRAMRDDRITQVDIRRIKPKGKGTLEAFVGEAAKYATKPSSYILENERGKYEADPQVVTDLHHALRGRRLVAFGGLFNQIRKEKKLIGIEKADLVNVNGEAISDNCRCKFCDSELIEEIYRWNFGLEQYLKVSNEREDEVFWEDEMAHSFDISEEEEACECHYHGLEEEVGDASYEIKETYPQDVGAASYGFEEVFPMKVGDVSEEEEENSINFSHYKEEGLGSSPCFIEMNRQTEGSEPKKEESQGQILQFKKDVLASKCRLGRKKVRLYRSESSLIPLRGPP